MVKWHQGKLRVLKNKAAPSSPQPRTLRVSKRNLLIGISSAFLFVFRIIIPTVTLQQWLGEQQDQCRAAATSHEVPHGARGRACPQQGLLLGISWLLAKKLMKQWPLAERPMKVLQACLVAPGEAHLMLKIQRSAEARQGAGIHPSKKDSLYQNSIPDSFSHSCWDAIEIMMISSFPLVRVLEPWVLGMTLQE